MTAYQNRSISWQTWHMERARQRDSSPALILVFNRNKACRLSGYRSTGHQRKNRFDLAFLDENFLGVKEKYIICITRMDNRKNLHATCLRSRTMKKLPLPLEERSAFTHQCEKLLPVGNHSWERHWQQCEVQYVDI